MWFFERKIITEEVGVVGRVREYKPPVHYEPLYEFECAQWLTDSCRGDNLRCCLSYPAHQPVWRTISELTSNA